jgi:predicted GTPase
MTMHAPAEVKIAFIGNPQSGKTSLVNAILQENHSRVANGSLSVGINSFRVVGKPIPPETKSSTDHSKSPVFVFGGASTVGAPPTVPTNPSVTNEFIALPNFRTMHMTTMDVELKQSIFDMYPETNFILTDVPGINAQDPEDIYLQYLNARWESFDCIVVVLNALEDVLLQLDILHLAKENLISKRETSLIFVCNKLDEKFRATSKTCEKYFHGVQ